MKTQKTKKRILSSVLAGLVAVTAMPMSVISAFSAELNTNSPIGSPQQPAKSSDGYYQISNADELYWFADYVNSGNSSAKAVLTKDIVVNSGTMSANTTSSTVRSWIPIGVKHDINNDGKEENYTFSGIFDGQNHSISGIYLNDSSWQFVGLFGRTYQAEIKNVSLVNSYFSANYDVAGIVGEASQCTITNCTNSSTIYTNSSHIGGIVAEASGGTISDCKNTGKVEGYYYYIGGIVGILSYAEVSNCTNTGVVQCNGWREVGGIVGRAMNNSNITNCSNSGKINSAGSETGGIVGSANSNIVISNCNNSSNIEYIGTTGSVAGSYGGIVGSTEGVTIKKCTNTGSVSNSNGTDCGGIIGYASTSTITECVNQGNITAKKNSAGIAGVAKYTGLTKCTNSGTITASDMYAAGIVGEVNVYEQTEISGCSNTGSITAKNYYAGGIAANLSTISLNSGSFLVFSNNFNSGTINAGEYAGGIVAVNEKDTMVVNCLNYGNVTDDNNNTYFSGGIIGKGESDSIIGRCYSSIAPIGINTGTNAGAVRVVTSDELKNGSIAYYLRAGISFSYNNKTYSFSGSPWGQDFLYGETYPTLNSKRVYYNYPCGSGTKSYSNFPLNSTANSSHKYENGICTACGANLTPTYNSTKGAYAIANAGNLYWFMEKVNAGSTNINAYLTSDIVLNKGSFNSDGTYTSSGSTSLGLLEWFPIGYYLDRNGDGSREDIYYSGVFDGNCHTISGLYLNKEMSFLGLFGQTKNATIKNLELQDSYIKGINYVGGICGMEYGNSVITNCLTTNYINATGFFVGGICGYKQSTSIIVNCFNAGKISTTGNTSFCGGIVGADTVYNCYNFEKACDYINGANSSAESSAQHTLNDLNSYKTSYMLQQGFTVNGTFYDGSVWGVKSISNSTMKTNFPTLNGVKIYKMYKCNSSEAIYGTEKKYNEEPNLPHKYHNGVCELCGINEPLEGIAINEANFPDEIFRELVKQKVDTSGNGYINNSEIENTKTIDATNKGINSLKGIEYLTALQVLYCYGNNLTDLDVSKNTELVMLNCGENQLTSLDVSKNTKLAGLYCYSNQLTNIDISMLKELDNASFANNSFKALDFSQNPFIRVIYCQNNNLESINLKNNQALSLLMCNNNNLSFVDVSNCPELSTLKAENNVKNFDVLDCRFNIDGMDIDKISDLTGATISNDGKIVPNANTITYTYQCSETLSETFTIKVTELKHNYINGVCVNCGGFVAGDTNLDGKLTIDDATTIQMFIAHITEFNDHQKATADINNDGIVNILDVTYIQQMLAGVLN